MSSFDTLFLAFLGITIVLVLGGGLWFKADELEEEGRESLALIIRSAICAVGIFILAGLFNSVILTLFAWGALLGVVWGVITLVLQTIKGAISK